jgi:hypothetical protein
MPMRNYFLISVLFIFLLSSSFAADQKAEFQKLSFLEGCWKGETDGEVVYETWGNQDGNLMLGGSKTISKGKAQFFEFLSIVIKDGKIHYVPYVNGINTISFPLVSSGESEAEFSNPQHDFPKSIKYVRNGRSLQITLSGDGKIEEYVLNSISCVQ